eukprot:1179784-Prorocentrum_minimum.AAC.4
MRSSPGSDGALRAKVRPASENSPHPPHVLYRYGIVTLSLFGASRPAARAQRRMRVHPRSNHESYRLVQDRVSYRTCGNRPWESAPVKHVAINIRAGAAPSDLIPPPVRDGVATPPADDASRAAALATAGVGTCGTAVDPDGALSYAQRHAEVIALPARALALPPHRTDRNAPPEEIDSPPALLGLGLTDRRLACYRPSAAMRRDALITGTVIAARVRGAGPCCGSERSASAVADPSAGLGGRLAERESKGERGGAAEARRAGGLRRGVRREVARPCQAVGQLHENVRAQPPPQPPAFRRSYRPPSRLPTSIPRGEQREKVGNRTQGEKRGGVAGVLSALLPLLAQEDPLNEVIL